MSKPRRIRLRPGRSGLVLELGTSGSPADDLAHRRVASTACMQIAIPPAAVPNNSRRVIARRPGAFGVARVPAKRRRATGQSPAITAVTAVTALTSPTGSRARPSISCGAVAALVDSAHLDVGSPARPRWPAGRRARHARRHLGARTCADSHLSQSGHHEPGYSVGAGAAIRRGSPGSSPSRSASAGTSWLRGGLTTPAMWPEPASMKRTGPENSCVAL